MNFNELIQQFSKYNSHLTIDCDEIGVVRFFVNNDHLIYMRNALDDKTYFLYAQVGELPIINNEKLICYQKLLEANLFGDGVGQANLSIHLDTNSIILTQTFNAQYTDYSAFEDAYHRFFNYLCYWSDELQK